MNEKQMELCSLERALQYQDSDIIDKFLDEYDVTKEEAQDLFTQTKKWLWLCYMKRQESSSVRCAIRESLMMLDNMWHTFILFTKKYSQYCHDHFGYFIHHNPANAKDQKIIDEKDHQEKLKKSEQEIEELIRYVYDKLGEQTAIKWFSEYKDKYTPEVIKKLKK